MEVNIFKILIIVNYARLHASNFEMEKIQHFDESYFLCLRHQFSSWKDKVSI